MSENKKEFIYCDNWFEKKYAGRSAFRFHTFKTALNLIHQFGGKLMLETGCVRLFDDYGAGYSTVMLGDYAKTYDAKLITVDLTRRNVEMCKTLTKDYEEQITYVVSDSVQYLKGFDSSQAKIDFLYLDSYDYPYGELMNLYGGRQDINAAEATLKSMTLEEIVEKHEPIIMDCQEHCLNELLAALPHIHDRTPILIDDNLPGGGKGRLARDWLLKNGYTCLIDMYQSLWVKRV